MNKITKQLVRMFTLISSQHALQVEFLHMDQSKVSRLGQIKVPDQI